VDRPLTADHATAACSSDRLAAMIAEPDERGELVRYRSLMPIYRRWRQILDASLVMTTSASCSHGRRPGHAGAGRHDGLPGLAGPGVVEADGRAAALPETSAGKRRKAELKERFPPAG
jgi:hypothetical protein